jgi:hypothetical protein
MIVIFSKVKAIPFHVPYLTQRRKERKVSQRNIKESLLNGFASEDFQYISSI